jgi:hypothetical protein
MSEPTQTVLTPAQVELLEEMLEQREARLIAYVNDSIAAAMTVLRQECTAATDGLEQQLAADLTTKVTYGEHVGLRAANQHTLAAVQNDLAEQAQSIRWEWGDHVGAWESFIVERGQA